MHPRELSIADFSYDLPEDRIAQRPLDDRSASRLLVMREGQISDGVFADLPEQLPSGSLLVLNDTRVVNARIVFHRATGARIELLCLSPAHGGPVERSFAERGQSDWNCFIGNAKRWKESEQLVLHAHGSMLRAERIGTEVVRFTWEPAALSFADVLKRFGHVPLPPYMKRPDEPADEERYNTVFARHEGSVAAPTASLHFSDEVLRALHDKGASTAELTLHVGAGTFLPVKSERMHDHRMHEEQVRISRSAIEAVRERLGNGPIVAVGTTAMRTLESLYWHGLQLFQGENLTAMDVGQWEPYEAGGTVAPAEALDAVLRDLRSRGEDRLTGSTRLLIAPGYRFRYADALITNFHQPQSTLLLLVAAFVGQEWRAAYEHALSHGYRFLSYGDGSLLWRKDAR
ncbi:MAG: S-adenosylmethionine:tRNA ribosyltransferase-isomerase [Flavobacteriales bacterium]|nr:S-adenosylmethionine:tRNA ribosyltransferase-isomerase [Flavobacteriales bacterium]